METNVQQILVTQQLDANMILSVVMMTINVQLMDVILVLDVLMRK
jgi:hypothetical protein